MAADIPVTLRSAVQKLMSAYGWKLVDVETLCQSVWSSTPADPDLPSWESKITYAYASVLYQACQSQAETRQREQAYTELHRYLYAAACKSYPDLSPIDLAQDAIRLVCQQIERCHTPSAFYTFAFNKLRQVAKEARRRHQGQGREVELTTIEEQTGEIGQQPTTPFEEIAQRERTEAVINALKSLSDWRQRAAVEAKYFNALSDEEIGKQLGVTAQHVRVLRTRALQQLRSRQELKQYLE